MAGSNCWLQLQPGYNNGLLPNKTGGSVPKKKWGKPWTLTFYNATGCGLLCLNTCNPENVPTLFCCCKYWRFFNASDSKKLWVSATFDLLCLTRLHKTHVSREGKYIQCLQYIQGLVGEPWKMEGTIPPKSVASTCSRNWASAECWTRKGRNPPYSNVNDGCKWASRWLPWRHRKQPVFATLTGKKSHLRIKIQHCAELCENVPSSFPLWASPL